MKKVFIALATAAITAACAVSMAACDDGNTIYVDTNAFFAPFEYYNENQEIVGVDIEIMNKVGEKLGKKVEFENTAFELIIDNVSSGKKYDCGAAGITITEARKKQVDFSNPYYTAVQYVICDSSKMNKDGTTADGVDYVLWSSLQGKNIGTQTDTTGYIFVDAEMGTWEDDGGETVYGALCNPETGEAYAGTSLINYPSAPVAVGAMGSAIDVIVVDELPAKYLANANENLSCYALYYDAETATEEQYAICVTKGNTELLNAINSVLEELGEDGINALVKKHLGLDN